MNNVDRFELAEANASDADEIINIMVLAYKDDEMWKYTFQKVPYYGRFRFFYEYNTPRNMMEDVTCFKITEKATGKMVAYTALQYPWIIRPLDSELKTELSVLNPPAGMPLAPKGLRLDGFIEMFNMFTSTHLEHDPEKDFHRMGTHVLPEYQRQGLGSWLTKHCNSIADAHQAKTYVAAGCRSRDMFKALGFKKFGVFNPHAERWGGEYDVEMAKYELLVREPNDLKKAGD